MAQLVILKALAICLSVFLALSAAGPINKRSTSADDAVFEMDERNYDEADWSKDGDAVRLVEGTKHLVDVCPNKISTNPADPIYNRSSCPWTYELDYDPLRFPASILKAKTRCTYCITDNADEPNTKYECAPVTQDFNVLKRREDAVDGKYTWEPYIKRVAIGYTCTGRKLTAAATPAPTPATASTEQTVDYDDYA